MAIDSVAIFGREAMRHGQCDFATNNFRAALGLLLDGTNCCRQQHVAQTIS